MDDKANKSTDNEARGSLPPEARGLSPAELEQYYKQQEEATKVPSGEELEQQFRTSVSKDLPSTKGKQKTGTLGSFEPSWRDKLYYAVRKHPVITASSIAAVLVTVVLLVVFVIIPAQRIGFTGEKVSLAIDAPETLASGDQITYTITITNGENVAIKDSEMTMFFPTGFSYQESNIEPSNPENTSWAIGAIAAESTQDLIITGTLEGDKNSSKSVEVRFVYLPQNISSTFSEPISARTIISIPDLLLTVQAPKSSASGNQIEYTVEYQNTSDQDIDAVVLRVAYDSGFAYGSASPEPNSNEHGEWNLGTVATGTKGRVAIKGVLNGNNGEAKRITATVGVVNAADKFIAYHQQFSATSIVELSLAIDMKVNNEREVTVDPGDRLRYAVTYKNMGNAPVSNVSVEVPVVSDFLDLSTVSVEGGALVGKKIVWDSSGVAGFSVLKPNDEGTVSFSVEVDADPQDAVPGSENISINTAASIFSTDIALEERADRQITSSEAVVKVSTEFAFDSFAVYYDDLTQEQRGTGPLPPVVGDKTTYEIKWVITNTTNDVKNVRVSALLGAGIDWENSVSTTAGGDVTYNPGRRQVVWDAGLVPADKTSPTDMVARFKISITPGPDRAGKVAVLLQEAITTGTDSFTLEPIELSTEVSSTELKQDPIGRLLGGAIK